MGEAATSHELDYISLVETLRHALTDQICFLDSLRARLDTEITLQKAEHFAHYLRKSSGENASAFKKNLEANRSYFRELARNCELYVGILVLRTMELTSRTQSALSERALLTACILCRSNLELSAIACADVNEFAASLPDADELRTRRRREFVPSRYQSPDPFDILMKFIWGARSPDVVDILRRPSIFGKIVQPALSELSLPDEKYSLNWIYERLSECVHPFRLGHHCFFHHADNQTSVKYRLGEPKIENACALADTALRATVSSQAILYQALGNWFDIPRQLLGALDESSKYGALAAQAHDQLSLANALFRSKCA